VQILDKFYISLGKCFNGWNLNDLINYICLSVGSKNNDFKIGFINGRYDINKNITYYRIPEKINTEFLIYSKRIIPEYSICENRNLSIVRFLIEHEIKYYHTSINGNIIMKDAMEIWKITCKSYDYFEYDGKSVDINLWQTKISNLSSIKIFSTKYRLNGG
jgi:hypothetical protein